MKSEPSKEYVKLVEASNMHHNAVHDYLEAHGADQIFQTLICVDYHTAISIAKKNGFEVSDTVDNIGRWF